MTMDEKYDCTDCVGINDHVAVKGFTSAKMVSGRYSDRLLVETKNGDVAIDEKRG